MTLMMIMMPDNDDDNNDDDDTNDKCGRINVVDREEALRAVHAVPAVLQQCSLKPDFTI